MRKKLGWFLLFIEVGILAVFWKYNENKIRQIIDPIREENIKEEIVEEKQPDKKITPTRIVEIKTTPTTVKKKSPTPTPDNQPWGVSKQIDEVTWTMKVGEDEKMATPQEVLIALNEYRKRYNSQPLTWDNKLGDYAQTRAKYLNSIKSVDKHEGFSNFVEKEDGFNKLGFNALGENISFGYKLNGVHIIEWMYAGDKPHNDNQLDNKWNYVGIGIDGLATCLIFGTAKF